MDRTIVPNRLPGLDCWVSAPRFDAATIKAQPRTLLSNITEVSMIDLISPFARSSMSSLKHPRKPVYRSCNIPFTVQSISSMEIPPPLAAHLGSHSAEYCPQLGVHPDDTSLQFSHSAVSSCPLSFFLYMPRDCGVKAWWTTKK